MELATKDGVHAWTFEDQLWQQTSDDRFSLLSIAGVEAAKSPIDLDYLAGAQLAPGSSTEYLPAAFRFCPQSGERLPAPAWNARNHWLPPYGNGSGSRVVADGELDSAQQIVARIFQRVHQSGSRNLNDSKEEMEPLPGKQGLVFFVADAGGYRDALFAMGRNGALHLWLRNRRKWQQLQPANVPIGRIALPNWAWSVALLPGKRGHDLLIAGSDGAVLVSIDAPACQYRTQHFQGKALASAGLLAGKYWLPVCVHGTGMQLVSRSEDGWEYVAITGDINDSVESLSAPINDPASGRLLWIGKQGYLSLSQAGLQSEPQAIWQPWPNDAFAEPHMGPPFRDGSGLWQLIFEAGSRYYIQLDSRATDRSESIKGLRLSTEHLSFKYNIRLDIPWKEDHDEHLTPMTEQVVYPFIEFRSGKYLLALRDKSESRIAQFFDRKEALNVQYCLDEIDGISLSLDARASEPWNAQWFFYDNAMWLYIESSGALYRWKA